MKYLHTMIRVIPLDAAIVFFNVLGLQELRDLFVSGGFRHSQGRQTISGDALDIGSRFHQQAGDIGLLPRN